MRLKQILESSTVAGSISTVATPLFNQSRSSDSTTKVKKKGPYANSLTEGAVKQLSMDLKELSDSEFLKKYKKTKADARKAMKEKPEPVAEAQLSEEDKIIAVGKGKKLKTGLHGKEDVAKLAQYKHPFRSSGIHVSDTRGNKVCECENEDVARDIVKALNAYITTNEGAGVIAGGPAYEGAKVDRMVKHIEKSEEKAGKGKKEAENIAWATANKRGMLNNKNKKAK
jgi:hypothetical protein